MDQAYQAAGVKSWSISELGMVNFGSRDGQFRKSGWSIEGTGGVNMPETAPDTRNSKFRSAHQEQHGENAGDNVMIASKLVHPRFW